MVIDLSSCSFEWTTGHASDTFHGACAPCGTKERRDPTTTTTATATTRREERRQKTRFARARCATVNTDPSTEPKPRCGVREPAQLQLVPARGSAASRWNRENHRVTRWGGHGSTKNRPLAPPPRSAVERQATPLHETRYCLSLSVLQFCLVRPCLEHHDYFAPRRAPAPENRLHERTAAPLRYTVA